MKLETFEDVLFSSNDLCSFIEDLDDADLSAVLQVIETKTSKSSCSISTASQR